MKSKKTAFTNSSTGYGRQKHGLNKSSASNKSEKVTASGKDKNCKDAADKCDGTAKRMEETDNDLNSGFGDYLRTSEAFEMMKLFVFANTIMLIVTMAWPNIKEQFFMLNQWWENFQYESN